MVIYKELNLCTYLLKLNSNLIVDFVNTEHTFKSINITGMQLILIIC